MRHGCPGVLLVFVLAGCAGGSGGRMRVNADHPAHPDAAAAPLMTPSSVLALESDADAPPIDTDADAHDMHLHEDVDDDHDGDGGAEAPSTAPYVCPMHREVGSMDPTARCPKCGMKLVPREEVEDQ